MDKKMMQAVRNVAKKEGLAAAAWIKKHFPSYRFVSVMDFISIGYEPYEWSSEVEDLREEYKRLEDLETSK